jgi:hypothetical protein
MTCFQLVSQVLPADVTGLPCFPVKDITETSDLVASPSVRAVWGVVLDLLVAEYVGSNPAYGMDICLCLSVLCCRVWVEALRRAAPSKES